MPDSSEDTPAEAPRGAIPPAFHDAVREAAHLRLAQMEAELNADVLTIISPILYGLEHVVRNVVESRPTRRHSLVVILDTLGGVVEVVERVVRVFRQYYKEVRFLVPDRALSAGTVLAMSGDAIMMDYHSCLGPIDPQIERDGRLVPALSYLSKVEELIGKSNSGTLSTAEVILLQKLDLAELHQFELARDLSTSLLKEWLTKYKFKDWEVTETRGLPVTEEMKVERAKEIAARLNNQERWGSHGRGIDMRTLRDELKVKIDDYGENPTLRTWVWEYFWFLRDFMRNQGVATFVHSPHYF